MARKKQTNQNSLQLTQIAQLLGRQAAGEILRGEFASAPERNDFPSAEYLRPTQVARLLDKSLRTVRRWIENQTLPSSKIGGSRLIAVADLERLLQRTAGIRTTEADDA